MRYSNVFNKKSSRILLGTAYFGDGISEEDSFAIMDKFCELGGTHIDTARLYADGVAEEIVGKWVKSRKAPHIQISTKGGYPYADSLDCPRLSEEEIRSDLENSLKATGFEKIDFYWLHQDDKTIPAGQIIEMLNSLVKEGKILDFGVSNWTVERIKEAQQYAQEHNLKKISASQLRFNPAVMNPDDRYSHLVGMDRDSFKFYQESNLPVVAYSSQAKGFFSKMSEHGIDSLSQKAKDRYLNSENMKTLKVLEELSCKYSCSVASVICSAFCSLDVPEVFPIIGGRNIGQITDSMNGAEITLTMEEVKKVLHTVM